MRINIDKTDLEQLNNWAGNC